MLWPAETAIVRPVPLQGGSVSQNVPSVVLATAGRAAPGLSAGQPARPGMHSAAPTQSRTSGDSARPLRPSDTWRIVPAYAQEAYLVKISRTRHILERPLRAPPVWKRLGSDPETAREAASLTRPPKQALIRRQTNLSG